MSGLAIFLAPIAAIMVSDYWLVKQRHIDVPSLYRRHARYRYNRYGINWRAAVAFVISVVPNCPGLAVAVNPSVNISSGIQHIYNMNYLWGFTSALLIYWVLSHFFPAADTLLESSIYEDLEVYDGVEYKNDGVHTPEEVGKVDELSYQPKTSGEVRV